MTIGVSSYSFRKLTSIGKMTDLEAVDKAKSMGFEAIEFSGFVLPDGETMTSYAKKIREASDRAALPVAAYTIGADFLNPEGGDWKSEVERLRGELEIAEILGAPRMRHDATRGYAADYTGKRGFADALPVLAAGCRAVTEIAADMGIQTMVENHGFFCQDSDRVEALANAVDHSNFGLLLDIGNFLCADEDAAKAIGRVAPYAIHAHAKDFHLRAGNLPNPGRGWFRSRAGNYLRGSIIGQGEVPVGQCIGILKRSGYDGVLSVEFEGMEDPILGIEVGLENLKAMVASA